MNSEECHNADGSMVVSTVASLQDVAGFKSITGLGSGFSTPARQVEVNGLKAETKGYFSEPLTDHLMMSTSLATTDFFIQML